MRGKKLLLLLAVFMIQGRCQRPNGNALKWFESLTLVNGQMSIYGSNKYYGSVFLEVQYQRSCKHSSYAIFSSSVSMSPELKDIFSGDLFYLKCNSTSGGTVKWYFNSKLDSSSSTESYKIAVADVTHSGDYHCEVNGGKSDTLVITVLAYMPIATLTLKTGQPVMQKGASVILNLHNYDGIKGWRCWVYRGQTTKRIVLKNPEYSLDFQPNQLNVPETIFWCTDENKHNRSNQIVVRTSEKPVSLEMYNLPAVAGESLSMRCLVWGTDKISETVFYKGRTIISQSSNVHNIANVTEAENGTYSCDATFTYKDKPAGSPYKETSDAQDLFVQVSPIKASLSEHMYCSCKGDTNNANYHWYYKNGSSWARDEYVGEGPMKPKESGTYACRAVWTNKRSLLSNTIMYEKQTSSTLLLVIILLVILLLAAVAVYLWYRRRNTTVPVYEDVALRARDKVDKGDPEYDTLNPEAPDTKKREGEYEPLKKGEMKEGEYHTLGMVGAAGGEGGYEALKKEGMKEGVYHTLGTEGAAGGEGGYEALKKGEMKEGVYHTLSAEGATGGEGGYEALKKGEMKEGVYHTLSAEGATGGEGGYEALKKGEMKEGVYHTLSTEGAAGAEGGNSAVGKENKDKAYEIVDEKQEAKVGEGGN